MSSSDDSQVPPTSGTGSSWTSTLKSWRSVLPGHDSRSDEDKTIPDPDPSSHQVTDYREGERRDIHGNVVQLGNGPSPTSQPQEQTAEQIPTGVPQHSANDTQQSVLIKEQGRAEEQLPSIASARAPSDPQTTILSRVEEAANKTVKAIVERKKNVVLPDYYEQFSDIRPSLLLSVPVGSADLAMVSQAAVSAISNRSLVGRAASVARCALNSVKSLLFLTSTPAPGTSSKKLMRGTQGIRKVAIVGVHGWFPRKALRTVVGEPTGTSWKFCDEMNHALKEYLQTHGKHLDSEDVTLIALEGEGKVLDRVEMLHQSLITNHTWRRALHEADLVLVATHSQGTPTTVLLLTRWIEQGLLRVKEDDPKRQRIGVLAMAGISHGPFPFLKGNLALRFFETEAAKELFEFMDSESRIAKKYWEGLRTVLMSGIRLTCVASLEDQVVPLYSAIMTSIHHPSIIRAVYADAGSYENDFLINLISFALRLRNAGVNDHGILEHLSEVIAGSLYGNGHSAIYDEREVYLLSIRSLLEPPTSLTPEAIRSDPILSPFKAKLRLNPFYLPWGMRGIADEIMAGGDQVLIMELDRLMKLYSKWDPATKGMKEIKFRLEPIRSKL